MAVVSPTCPGTSRPSPNKEVASARGIGKIRKKRKKRRVRGTHGRNAHSNVFILEHHCYLGWGKKFYGKGIVGA